MKVNGHWVPCVRNFSFSYMPINLKLYMYYGHGLKICMWFGYNPWIIFSSPEPSGSQGELIVYPCSVVRPSVRRPPFSKIFFSETAWPIKAKFYMKHLWEGGTNVYINNPGHMTKMAAMPIYGKNPSKIFFSGTTGPISTKLGMKHQ